MPERIPSSPKEFDIYIKKGDNYLNDATAVPLNWLRLCLTLIIAGLWTTQRKAWDLLYAKYSDPLQKTTPIIKAVALFIDAFKTTAKPWLDTMAACAGATSDDEAVFHFVRDAFHANPTHKVLPIAADNFPITTSMGGQKIKTKCRTSTSTKRASLPKGEGADSVRKSYAISTTADNGPANQDSVGTVKEITPGATSILALPADSSGSYLNSWEQWYDSKHPLRAGVWGKKTVTLIV